MCIALICLHQSERYPIIILDNRDEDRKRPTRDALLCDKSGVIKGQDMQAGGTWMGLNTRSGMTAVLTNVVACGNDRHIVYGTSRGHLVDLLLQCDSVDKMGDKLDLIQDDYAGFNVLFGDIFDVQGEWRYASNRTATHPPLVSENGQLVTEVLGKGIHCVSNSFLNDESWHKVRQLRESVQKINFDAFDDPQELCHVLADLLCQMPRKGSTNATIPDYLANHHDGIDMLTHHTQSIFVDHAKSGFKTTSQTIVIHDRAEQTVHYFYRNTEDLHHPHLDDNDDISVDYETLWHEFVRNGWARFFVPTEKQSVNHTNSATITEGLQAVKGGGEGKVVVSQGGASLYESNLHASLPESQ